MLNNVRTVRVKKTVTVHYVKNDLTEDGGHMPLCVLYHKLTQTVPFNDVMRYRDNVRYGKYNIISIQDGHNLDGFTRAIDIRSPETTANCSLCFVFTEEPCSRKHAD